MDRAGIPPGAEFMRLIQNQIASGRALVAVIADDWLSPDAAGNRRIDDPDDPVRREIESAISNNLQKVPVLVGNARHVDSSQLPSTLKRIASLNAIRFTNEMFDDCMERLIGALEPIAGAPRAGRKAGMSVRSMLMPAGVATAATAVTVWAFDASRVASAAPFSAGETLFVFLLWFGVSVSTLFLIARAGKRRGVD